MKRRRFLGANAHDRLEEELEPILLRRARDTRNPMHFGVTIRDPIRLVDVDAVTAFVLRGIAGDVRSAHDRRDTFGLRTDLYHTDTGAHRKSGGTPDETILLDRLPDAIGDAGRLLWSTPFEQDSKLVATETRDGVGGTNAPL